MIILSIAALLRKMEHTLKQEFNKNSLRKTLNGTYSIIFLNISFKFQPTMGRCGVIGETGVNAPKHVVKMRFDHELEAVSMVKAIQLLLIQL